METRVFVPPEPLGRWLARLARRWSSSGLIVAHVAGALLAFNALADAWRFRLLIQILWDRLPVLGVGPLWLLVPLLLAVVGAVSIVQIVTTARRIWKGEQDDAAALKWRALLYVAIGCVLFNAFVLSTPEAFSGPFRVRFPVLAGISAAFAYGVYIAWVALLPRFRRAIPPRARRTIDIIGMNVVIVLVLVELTLRGLAIVWASPLLVTASSPSQIRRDSERRQPGSLLFGFPINQGGHHDTEFRPREKRERRTVIGIGDSFSYGVVPHAFHFTTVAERAGSGFEIYNMGYPGIGPIDYLHLLKNDALPLQPDLILIHAYVGNDISDSPLPAGPARWHDADSYLSAVVWYRLQMLRRAKKIDVTQGVNGGSADTVSLAQQYPWLDDPMREPASINRDVYLQLELQNARGVARPSAGAYMPFLEALAAMTHVAGDVPIGFVLIPDEFQVEDDLWAELVRMSGDSLDRDRPQRLVGDWLRRMDLPVLDLLPALRSVEPLADGRRHVYHLQDTHFNARGNAVAGRVLASFVDSLLSAPRRPRRLAAPDSTAAPPPPPRTLPFLVDFADSTMRAWMGGWHQAERSGPRSLAWSAGMRSVLLTALPTGADLRMVLEVLPYEYPGASPQRIRIAVNGTEVTQLRLRPGLEQYTVTIPAGVLRESPQRFEFSYAWTKRPADAVRGGTDIRDLAVAWFSLSFMAP